MARKIIVVGQGLCGTFLSWNLIKAGNKVTVIDESKPNTATKVASGVINPVTGRRIVRTWRIEELLPFAREAYKAFEIELEVELVKQCNILDFHPSLQMKEAFDKRLTDEEYLKTPGDVDKWRQYFNYYFGVGEINPCLLVDLNLIIDKWRTKLKEQNVLIEEPFNWNNCKIDASSVTYKDITAEKIIFCEGVAGFDNPYFKNLPYTRMKGEVLIADIPGLPTQNIYKQGLNIVPWKDGLFWIGSSYEWKFKDIQPTEAFRKKCEEQLKHWLKIPFKIVDHLASERPANMERRPFVGLHPHYPSVGVFNGMGTKGASLAPFFAHQFTGHLTNQIPIYPDADVRRFQKTLLREMN